MESNTDKFTRKLARLLLHGGEVVMILLFVLAFVLDWIGAFALVFPGLSQKTITLGIFGLFFVYYLFQRLSFESNRSFLEITNSGWERIRTGGLERLYVEVSNIPIINSERSDSNSTGAKVFYVSKKTKRKILPEFQNVRWQGTPAPNIKDGIYQPYENWAVPIKSGRSRYLYIAQRSTSSTEKTNVFIHNDKSYKNGIEFVDELKLPDNDCFVCIVLWSNNSDEKAHWFSFDGEKLIPSKPEKEIANIVSV